MSDIIVGVERTLEDIGELAKWNKKRLRWVITHNAPNCTRQHIIDLEMVLVSSERIVKVDDVAKHRAMVSFGYECEFEISNRLKGRIKQDGLTYELYINGKSFSQLTKTEYNYEPPTLQFNNNDASPDPNSFNPYTKNTPIKTEINPFMPKLPESKKVLSSSSKPQKQQKPAVKFVLKQPPKTQDALKTAQQDLMRLMIEQKRRKKQLQQMKND